jgi:hypothetical protein
MRVWLMLRVVLFAAREPLETRIVLGHDMTEPATAVDKFQPTLLMAQARCDRSPGSWAQYQVVDHNEGLSHLVAVSATSMGASSPSQWAVERIRPFMDAVIPIGPQAYTAKQSVFT